jgi:hypothetical protein
MTRKENYYEIWAASQETVRRLFKITPVGIKIGNSRVILVEGDLKLQSLDEGIGTLEGARKELEYCLRSMQQILSVREIAKSGEISGGTAKDVEDRLDYISRFTGAVERAIKYLGVPQILEKDAFLVICELAKLVRGGSPAPPITITICEEYTI